MEEMDPLKIYGGGWLYYHFPNTDGYWTAVRPRTQLNRARLQ